MSHSSSFFTKPFQPKVFTFGNILHRFAFYFIEMFLVTFQGSLIFFWFNFNQFGSLDFANRIIGSIDNKTKMFVFELFPRNQILNKWTESEIWYIG